MTTRTFVWLLVALLGLLLMAFAAGACAPRGGPSISETLSRHGVAPRIDGSLRSRPQLVARLSDALAVWLSDERDSESLRSIVRFVGTGDERLPCRDAEVVARILCWMARPGTAIGLETASADGARFWLEVPSLSDHLFFVEVKRDGHVLRARSWGEN